MMCNKTASFISSVDDQLRQKSCVCTSGMVDGGHGECVESYALANDVCPPLTFTCNGGAACNRAVRPPRCECAPGHEKNATSGQCVPKQVYAGSDCQNGELCIGGSVCDSAGAFCTCPSGRVPDDGVVPGVIMCVQRTCPANIS